MATVVTHSEHYSAIADAIREKTGGSETYTPAQMAGAISNLPSGGESTLKQYFDISESASGLFSYYEEYANSLADNFDFIQYNDTSSVKYMSHAFAYQSNITSIPLINTELVENFQGMFDNCSSLTTCPALNCGRATSVNALRYMFYACTSLREVNITMIKANLDLSEAYDLQNISTVISNLINVGDTRVLKISSNVQITPEQNAIANQKGWDINRV